MSTLTALTPRAPASHTERGLRTRNLKARGPTYCTYCRVTSGVIQTRVALARARYSRTPADCDCDPDPASWMWYLRPRPRPDARAEKPRSQDAGHWQATAAGWTLHRTADVQRTRAVLLFCCSVHTRGLPPAAPGRHSQQLVSPATAPRLDLR